MGSINDTGPPVSTMNRPVFDLSDLGTAWKEATRETGARKHRFAVFQNVIKQSPNDDRQYRLITLENGLTALLVSSPSTDKAACSLLVGAGSLLDPPDLPGLAHYLEHMLFLGSEGYPADDEWEKFISQNGGRSSAGTGMISTNYYFDVQCSSLQGALSRHSQFFSKPLFRPEASVGEVERVDSEFRNYLSQDVWRLFQLTKSLSSQESEWRKFNVGNKESLLKPEFDKRGLDLRARLLQWYNSYYSSNVMSLAILSSHTLDELQELVIENYSTIPNNNLPSPFLDKPVLTSKEIQTEISWRTIEDCPQLMIQFPFPDQQAHWASKPLGYISHLLGHEGMHTPFSELKKQGWITSLQAGYKGWTRCAPGFQLFEITIGLTAAGLAHQDEVLSTLFSYIDLIRSTGPQSSLFDEIKQLGKLRWSWLEKKQPFDEVQDLAESLAKQRLTSLLDSPCPAERIIVQPYYATKYRPDLILESLEFLRAENCRVFVGTKDPLPGRVFWTQTEKYYGTEYDVRPLDIARLKSPIRSDVTLALPPRNQFIPTSFEIVAHARAPEPAKYPTLIHSTPTSCLFHKADDDWLVPRVSVHLFLKSPNFRDTAKHAAESKLFGMLVEDSLEEALYDARLAGIHYSLNSVACGIQLIVQGYNDKVPLVVEMLLGRIRNLEVDTSRFGVMHEQLSRDYSNAMEADVYKIGISLLDHSTLTAQWTAEQLLEAVKGLNPVDIETHAEFVLSDIKLEGLMVGNISEQNAIERFKSAETSLRVHSNKETSVDEYSRSLILPTGSNTMYRKLLSSAEEFNSTALIYYQVGPTTDEKTLAQLQVLSNIASERFFSVLGTQEKLGYIVWAWGRISTGMTGLLALIQSEKDAAFLERRISAFWDEFGGVLEEMTEEEVERHKDSLESKYLQKPKNLYEEALRYSAEIGSGEFDFLKRERYVQEMKCVTKPALLSFFHTFLAASPQRTKLTILLRSQRFPPDSLSPLLNLIPSSNLEEAKLLFNSKPTIEQIRTFVTKLTPPNEHHDRNLLETAVRELEVLPPLREGVEEMVDLEAFREKLDRGKPVQSFGAHALANRGAVL